MGIHSDWVKAFKAEVPNAFTDELHTNIAAGFIDGQIQLMKSRYVVTWEQFVQYQFVLPLQRLLRTHGAGTVVLAFDDYAHVPRAKGMTQAKRAKRAEPMQFHERAQLPALIPDYWDRAILNRNFKTRVIQLVIARVPALLELRDTETLIIDYKGAPRAYGGSRAPEGELLEGFAGLGEADLKFFRYAEHFGSLLAVTTDSDYLPITLLRLEAREREGAPQPRVVIQRLRVGEANSETAKVRPGRAFEFVDTNALRAGLATVLSKCATPHAEDCFWMARLCALVALFGGTDFSRGMPQIGPKRVWDNLPLASRDIFHAFDTARGQLDEHAAQERVVSNLYAAVFAAHARGARGSSSVFRALQRSGKLSARTKSALPSAAYIDASVRNANWILLYWGGDVRAEDESFGYRAVGARVTYADA